nr:toll/interleukin-1 receptor domain-containing protein [Mediterraneibacter glycyrrhizinilyticus]
MEKKVKVFLSYCHVDEMYKEELDKHFAPLKRSNKVETWNDRELKAGTKFDDNIKSHLNQDDIIILLISSDFFASDYCYNIEMQRAIERANRRECILIPIIVRPCLWTETPIKDILALPKDGKPISKYEDKDEAYLEIVTAVSDMIDSFESE